MAKKRFGSDPLDDLIVNTSVSKKAPAVSRQPSAVARRTELASAAPDTGTTNGEARQVTTGWESKNERLTFYCPTALVAQIEKEMERSDRSKSRVIVDAILAHLQSK